MENIKSKTPLRKNTINFLQTEFKNDYLNNEKNKNINFLSKKNLFGVQKLKNNQNKPVVRYIIDNNKNIINNNKNIIHINNNFNNVEQNKNFKIMGRNYICNKKENKNKHNNNNKQINYRNICTEEGKINQDNKIQFNNNFINEIDYNNNNKINKVNNLNNIGNKQLNKNKKKITL